MIGIIQHQRAGRDTNGNAKQLWVMWDHTGLIQKVFMSKPEITGAYWISMVNITTKEYRETLNWAKQANKVEL